MTAIFRFIIKSVALEVVFGFIVQPLEESDDHHPNLTAKSKEVAVAELGPRQSAKLDLFARTQEQLLHCEYNRDHEPEVKAPDGEFAPVPRLPAELKVAEV